MSLYLSGLRHSAEPLKQLTTPYISIKYATVKCYGWIVIARRNVGVGTRGQLGARSYNVFIFANPRIALKDREHYQDKVRQHTQPFGS